MSRIRKSIIAIITVQLAFGMLVPGVALAGSSVDNPTDNLPDSQVFEVSNGGQIEGWERAAYTLRTDDTDAATQVTQPSTVQGEKLGDGNSFSNNNDGQDSKSLTRDFDGDRNPIGVHESGQDVTIAFDANLATAGTYDQLDDQDRVELVAARLTPEDGKGVPDTTSDALDLLSNVDKANRNASFEMLDSSATINGSGQLHHTASFDPGHYVVFTAVHASGKNGIEVDADNNITVDGNVVIIGSDQLTVQQGSTSITEPPDPDSGENLTFDIDATNAFDSSHDGNVTHAIAIYDKSTFEDARFDLVVNESALGNDFALSDDAQLEHSLNGTNGIARVEDGTTLNGDDLSDGKVQRPVSVSSLIDFLADEAGTEDPNTDTITNGGANNSEYERIDASVTAINGENSDTTISVDTFGNFSTGEYQYVVVSALDENESQISTTTGTITLGGGGGGGGDDDDDDDDDDDSGDDGGNESDTPTEPDDPVVKPDLDRENGTISAPVGNVTAGQTVVLDINENATDDDDGTTLDQLNITSGDDSTNVQVTVSTSEQPSQGTPPVDRTSTAFRYVEVNTQNLNEQEVSQGTFTFSVSQQRLQDRGVAPEDVVMYRYNSGSWNALETTHRGGSKFRAVTPGFSSFAIGVAEPNISVTDASLSTTETQPGTPAEVSALVENNGDRKGNMTLEVTADGDLLKSRTVTVGADESTTESFSVTFDETGSYDIAVSSESAGTLTVVEQPPSTSTASSTPSDGTPTDETSETSTGTPGDDDAGGFPLITVGIVVILAALGAIIYVYRDQLLDI